MLWYITVLLYDFSVLFFIAWLKLPHGRSLDDSVSQVFVLFNINDCKTDTCKIENVQLWSFHVYSATFQQSFDLWVGMSLDISHLSFIMLTIHFMVSGCMDSNEFNPQNHKILIEKKVFIWKATSNRSKKKMRNSKMSCVLFLLLFASSIKQIDGC